MTPPVALVTGGNRSIGLQVAKDLYAKGYTVVIASRDASKAREAIAEITKSGEGKATEGQKVSFIQLDLSDTATISAAVSAFKSESNRLDVLVNNAAIYSEDRKATLETNYFNTIAVTDAFLPLLTQSAATAPNKRARVVIVSSRMGCFDWAKISGDALAALTDHNDLDKINALAKAWSAGDDSTGLSTVAYSTSKALINAYGRYLADRLTKEQIPVDIILTCPGTTKTDMNPAGTKTVEQGADTISWACYDSSVGTGKFYGHRTEIPYDTCDISLMGKV